MRVLVVEDEPDLANAVARGFRRAGIAVDTAYDGNDGYTMARATRYDVIVLDRDLPGMSGDELCRRVAATENLTRIIMLTASAAIDERIAGLSLGADDYLTKPYSHAELTARVRALYRRAVPAAPPVLTCGEIELDAGKRSVARAGKPIDLTPKEFSVLETLMMARGDLVSSRELLQRVWDSTANLDSGIVRVTMMNLRHKLGPPKVIRTAVGAGYRIENTQV